MQLNFRWQIFVALAATITACPMPAAAYSCWEDLSIRDYDPNLIRAIQQRLHDKGLFRSRIDGKVGPALHTSLSRLMGAPVKPDTSLTTPIAGRLFGQSYSGIYEEEDQYALMRKLGIRRTPNHRNACSVHVVDK